MSHIDGKPHSEVVLLPAARELFARTEVAGEIPLSIAFFFTVMCQNVLFPTLLFFLCSFYSFVPYLSVSSYLPICSVDSTDRMCSITETLQEANG